MSRYDEVFESYIRELRQAREEALAWWNSLLAKEALDGNLDAAEERVRPRWPCGPVSHPRVIGVYRKYCLQAHSINDEILERWDKRAEERRTHNAGWGEQNYEDEGIAKPSALLTENLIAVDPTLYEFIADLVFSPIGVDYDGRYA